MHNAVLLIVNNPEIHRDFFFLNVYALLLSAAHLKRQYKHKVNIATNNQ